MEDLDPLIDAATCGSVRRHLQAAHSPITTVMLVLHRDTLPLVGTALVAEDEAGETARRRSTTCAAWTCYGGAGHGCSHCSGPRIAGKIGRGSGLRGGR